MVNKTSGYIATVFAVAFMLFSIALILNTRGNLLTGYVTTNYGSNNTTLNVTSNLPNTNQNIQKLNQENQVILRDVQPINSQANIYGVTLLLKGSIINEKTRIEEKIPEDAEILEWNIIGTIEPMGEVYYLNQNGTVTWEFNSSRPTPVLSYKVRIPNSQKRSSFEATYYVNGITMGISSNSYNLNLLAKTEVQVHDTTNDGAIVENIETNRPATVSFDSPEYPIATVLALGSVILILIVAILLVSMKREGNKGHVRKDLHLMIHNAMQSNDKAELKIKYMDILREYNSKTEQEKHEYYNEVTSLYDFVIRSK